MFEVATIFQKTKPCPFSDVVHYIYLTRPRAQSVEFHETKKGMKNVHVLSFKNLQEIFWKDFYSGFISGYNLPITY